LKKKKEENAEKGGRERPTWELERQGEKSLSQDTLMRFCRDEAELGWRITMAEVIIRAKTGKKN